MKAKVVRDFCEKQLQDNMELAKEMSAYSGCLQKKVKDRKIYTDNIDQFKARVMLIGHVVRAAVKLT